MSLAVGRERIHLRSRKKTTGTTAGHDMRFISKMLDKFPEMEKFISLWTVLLSVDRKTIWMNGDIKAFTFLCILLN